VFRVWRCDDRADVIRLLLCLNEAPRKGALFFPAMKKTSPHPLHCYKGDTANQTDRLWLLVVCAICVLALAILMFMPRLAGMAQGAMQVLQLLALLAMIVAAIAGQIAQSGKRRKAGLALREAAALDEFWSPERLYAQVSSLFEPYWRGVVAGNVNALAERLTPYWRGRLEQTFGEWRMNNTRPVMFDLALKDIAVVGFEDWRNNQRDQVTVRVDARTSYHANNLPSGEVVEGMAASRDEAQLWQLVRGENGWLLNRVELVASPMAYRDCRVIREGV